MSRTEDHRPYWVKYRDPLLRQHMAVHHDHSTGLCDLEEFLASREWIRTRCTVQPSWGGPVRCRCKMCRGSRELEAAKRSTRTAWRATARTAVKTAAPDRADFDVAPPRRSSHW